jgi:hypothetical protein
MVLERAPFFTRKESKDKLDEWQPAGRPFARSLQPPYSSRIRGDYWCQFLHAP